MCNCGIEIRDSRRQAPDSQIPQFPKGNHINFETVMDNATTVYLTRCIPVTKGFKHAPSFLLCLGQWWWMNVSGEDSQYRCNLLRIPETSRYQRQAFSQLTIIYAHYTSSTCHQFISTILESLNKQQILPNRNTSNDFKMKQKTNRSVVLVTKKKP